MNRITRTTLAAGSAALLALTLGACGGPPTDASKDEYCEVVNDPQYFEDLDENSDEQDYLDAVRKIADDLREVGTPEDISDDAREGFEIQLDAVDELEAEDIDFESEDDPFQDGLSDDEKKKVEAYNDYESETCPGETDIGTPEEPEGS